MLLYASGGFCIFFKVLYSTLLHLPPGRFHCVGGCCRIEPRTFATFALAVRRSNLLGLIASSYPHKNRWISVDTGPWWTWDVAPFSSTWWQQAPEVHAAPLAPQLQLCAGLFLPGRSACCLTAPPPLPPIHNSPTRSFSRPLHFAAAVAAVVDGWNKLMVV